MRQDIVDSARSWLGTPFAHQGRHRKGIDCVGLVIKVRGEVLGIHEDFLDYGVLPTSSLVHEKLGKRADQTKDPGPGDIVLMRFGRDAAHIGFLTGEQTIIHADRFRGKVIEQPIQALNPVVYYRLRGVPPWVPRG